MATIAAAFQAQFAGSTDAQGPWLSGPDACVSPSDIGGGFSANSTSSYNIDKDLQLQSLSVSSLPSPYETSAAFIASETYQSYRPETPLSGWDLQNLFPVYYDHADPLVDGSLSWGFGGLVQFIEPAVGLSAIFTRSSEVDTLELDLYIGTGVGLGLSVGPSLSGSRQSAGLGFSRSASPQAVAIIPVLGTISLTGGSLSSVSSADSLIDLFSIHAIGLGPGAEGAGISVGINLGVSFGWDHQFPEMNPVRLGILPLDVPPF